MGGRHPHPRDTCNKCCEWCLTDMKTMSETREAMEHAKSQPVREYLAWRSAWLVGW